MDKKEKSMLLWLYLMKSKEVREVGKRREISISTDTLLGENKV